MKIPVFPNLGNTCFISSVLQCFIHNKEFKQTLEFVNSPFIDELKKVCEIVDTTNDGKFVAMFYNINNVLDFLPFERFEQQDAHECILLFLELLTKDPPIILENPLNGTDDIANPFIGMYYGQTKNSVHCLTCKNNKFVFEDFSSINLNVPLENSSIINLFVKYLEKELHEQENLYFCETCNSLNPYEKKINLYKLPKVLIIVLKRYTSNGTKILADIEIDETLVIKESISGTIKKYHLKGIINHFGNLYNGHYTNFIHNCAWLNIDDERVKMDNYDSKNAYILFYETPFHSV